MQMIARSLYQKRNMERCIRWPNGAVSSLSVQAVLSVHAAVVVLQLQGFPHCPRAVSCLIERTI